MFKNAADSLQKYILVQDQVVCRCYHHSSIGILFEQLVGCVSYAGSRVPLEAFQKDILLRNLRNLLCNKTFILFGSHYQYVFHRNNLAEAVNGCLKETFARSKQIQELFRVGVTGHWPETATDPTCHYYAILV